MSRLETFGMTLVCYHYDISCHCLMQECVNCIHMAFVASCYCGYSVSF